MAWCCVERKKERERERERERGMVLCGKKERERERGAAVSLLCVEGGVSGESHTCNVSFRGLSTQISPINHAYITINLTREGSNCLWTST